MFIARTLLSISLLMLCTSIAVRAETAVQMLGQPLAGAKASASWSLTITPTGNRLPQGQGNAATGAKIFALKCSSCHGPQGIGGSAVALTGDVHSLASDYPEKTVNSYWPYATTLFDYIRRAMPMDKPFSLSNDEVYALSAYILSEDGIISADTLLNKESLLRVKMPNRNGFVAVYPHQQ